MRVKNWHKFQHFKDRAPPWIKLYRDLLDDLEWHELPPAAAKALVMLWLIASENKGELPDMKTLAFRLRVSETQAKSIVSSLGHWLEQGDITEISGQHQADALEGETEREKERETDARKRAIKTSLPENFQISDRVKAWAAEKGHGRLPERFEQFVGYVRRSGKTYLDWDEAFMSAVREDWAKFGGPSAPRQKAALVKCGDCSEEGVHAVGGVKYCGKHYLDRRPQPKVIPQIAALAAAKRVA